MSLISTLSHWNANSYVSRNYAVQYLAAHPDYDIWENLADDRQEGCLRQATVILDGCPLWGGNYRLYGTAPYNQKLRFPLCTQTTLSGTIAAGYMNRISCTALADPATYREDFFTGGAVRITNADGSISIAEVDTFSPSSGILAFVNELTAAPVAGLGFTIVYPMPDAFYNGICEFAMEIARGGFDQTGQIIPVKIRSMLSNYFCQSVYARGC